MALTFLCRKSERKSEREAIALLGYRNRKFAISAILKVWKSGFQSLHKFNISACGFAGGNLNFYIVKLQSFHLSY